MKKLFYILCLAIGFANGTCEEDLEVLIGFGLIPAIGENLYQHTYALTSRPVFTLPALNNCPNYRDTCLGITFNIFYNSTPGLYTNKIDKDLNDYIKIAGSDILNKIEDESILEQIGSTVPLDVLDQFSNSDIHEHRVGALVSADYRYCNLRFEFGLPVVYQLRHYNLPEESILEIKRYNLFDQPTNKSNSSIYNYVVGDTIGFDDSFLRIGYVYEKKCLETETGLLWVIPTGTDIKTGLIGQNFRKYVADPVVNYANLISTATENTQYVQEILQEVSILSSYRLSAMVLNQPLGQESKSGIGLYNRGIYQLEDNCYLEWLAQGAYQFKRDATRYFITKKDPALYITEYYQEILDSGDEEKICAAVDFLNNSITNTLFPDPATVCLKPEWWYQLQAIAHADYECWHAQFGLDFWHRQKPKVYMNNYTFLKYNQEAAYLYFNQYQLKIVGGIGGYFKKCWGELGVWFKVDQTMIRQGIGLDRTFNLQFDLNF